MHVLWFSQIRFMDTLKSEDIISKYKFTFCELDRFYLSLQKPSVYKQQLERERGED